MIPRVREGERETDAERGEKYRRVRWQTDVQVFSVLTNHTLE